MGKYSLSTPNFINYTRNKIMNIRPYEDQDQEATIKLWEKCGLVVPWNNPAKDILRKCGKDRDLFLVGMVDGVLIASVMGGYDGHRGWINYLAVLPKYQHLGYAQVMMQKIEDVLTTLGCPKINLQVRTSNTKVIGFYQSLGFDLDDCVSLGKRLDVDGPKA